MSKVDNIRNTKATIRGGFSLIELLIVIAIISLFGFLVFGSLKKAEAARAEDRGIADLKKAAKNIGANSELICINKCKKCYMSPFGSPKLTEVASHLKPLTAYILDKNDNPEELDFNRVDDNPICLRFKYYANGSSSQMIIESEEKFYYFSSYFGDVKEFETLQEAAEEWLKYTEIVTNKGDYY